jgi:hypothetical protein
MILAAAHTEQLESTNFDLNLLLESLPLSMIHVGKCMAFSQDSKSLRFTYSVCTSIANSDVFRGAVVRPPTPFGIDG